MKRSKLIIYNLAFLPLLLFFLSGCSSSVNKNSNQMKNNENKGKYGYDVAFFSENKVSTIELKSNDSKACILIVPGYQGRVMTSSVDGNDGVSFGWINYKFIAAGKPSNQFNPFGGEERIWLGR
jgi:hypothetical protein